MFAYIYFLASIVFAAAAGLLVYTSYFENWESDVIWEMVKVIFKMMCLEDMEEYEKMMQQGVHKVYPKEETPLINKKDIEEGVPPPQEPSVPAPKSHPEIPPENK